MCEALGISCVDWPAEPDRGRSVLAEADWIVDGIAGTGLRGALRPPLSDLVPLVNAARGTRVAMDVPSGVRDGYRGGDPAVHSSFTLTMGLPKSCLYLPRARVSVRPDPRGAGGLSPRARGGRRHPRRDDHALHVEREGPRRFPLMPTRTSGAISPCSQAPGAPRAPRGSVPRPLPACRVGLVTLHASADAYPVIAPRLTSVMCRPWDVDAALGAAPPWDPAPFSAVLAGPGWGVTDPNGRWLRHLLSLSLPGVIDADALTLLGAFEAGAATLKGTWVLTPHPGEFSRLAGIDKAEVMDDPVARARAFASRRDAVVVLKGHSTVVAAPDGRYWILDGANPALATGGSGDVLAGIVAAGLAGGMTPVDAALFGVSLHAHVGRKAARRLGWFLAEDLVPLLSPALGT